MTKTKQAFSKDFFAQDSHPIAIRGILSDHGLQHDMDYTDSKHMHDFAELVIITEGYGIHWIDGEEYPVAAGDVFVLQGDTKHYFLERHGLTMYNIMYDALRLQQYLKNLQGDAGYNAMFILEPNYRRQHRFKSRLHLSRRSLAQIEPLVIKMFDEQKAQAAGYDTIMLGILLELVIFFSREYSKVTIPQAQALFRIGRIISKLETNYRRNWEIVELSRLAGMSKSSLMATFKNATGFTPVDYLIRIRLQKAAELLCQSDASIAEIARDSGFSDSNYLSRQFRKKYGSSPREYRRMNSRI
ncbi:MAG: helix-turn-helix domain-containing protein [Lentisphaerae bacterium]|nr:helix-turn-helix domain-containing protein [Lentisphaerota bacterium]MCP4103369.1 helix-turn-helix domain-containing protein [Lentisphaerota bacterium]